jgi:hypothetical protein
MRVRALEPLVQKAPEMPETTELTSSLTRTELT